MQIVDNLIILTLIVLAFIAGKFIADRYNEKIIKELEFQLRVIAAEKGIGYVAPPQNIKRMPIGQPFMDKLKQNGRAVQQISSSNTP